MKVGVLTSSRADYSIYFPLLKKLRSDPFFSLSILAFGTHLSEKHGYTLRQIEQDGFSVSHALETYPEDTTPASIAGSMASTLEKFTTIWDQSRFDLVFCLGDRYEMFAACSCAVPFLIPLAHIHGGERTEGAIDDAFRHAITHMSAYHFTVAEDYRKRVITLKGSEENVFNVGSLSIDNLKNLKLFDKGEFKDKYGIDMSRPSMLITFHPETVSYQKNEYYVDEVIAALSMIKDFQLIITMPNADTLGNLVRSRLKEFVERRDNAFAIESFGTIGYLSCMQHTSLMLGNTSSGYVEASYFPKYVIDLGTRQEGRVHTANIHKCGIERNEILSHVEGFRKYKGTLPAVDIYGTGNSADRIIEIVKNIHD